MKLPTLPDGYEWLLWAPDGYVVAIRSSVRRELEKKASREKQAELEALIRRYAEYGPSGLPRTRFNGQEGWFPSDKAQGKVRLEAFKPFQLRAYGFCRSYKSRPTFFITGVDISKKRDEANPAVLKSSGNEAFELSSSISKEEKR